MSGHVNQCVACGIGMPEGDMICRKCGVEPSDFERYQRQALRTANDFHTGKEWLCNVGLGLAGEAGEVADLIKKIAFHGHPLDRDKLMDEMGDVLWYLAQDAEALKANVARLIRMTTQKTAGQRGKAGDIDWDSLTPTLMNIAISATAMCLDGAFGEMPKEVEE